MEKNINETIAIKRKSQFGDIWHRFKKNKIAMIGLIIFMILFLTAVFASFITPYENALTQNTEIRNQGPSAEHWFGVDNYGRDIFARIVHGARNSLLMGIAAVVIGISLGGIFGAIAGYKSGFTDSVIMRIMDTIGCIPSAMLGIAIIAALGMGMVNVLIALMISMIPQYTRVVRSAVLTVVEQDYIEAARACGSSDFAIIFKHVLRNAIGPIIVQATMSVGSMIIWAAGMSFLGMGIQPPAPEWGAMLSEGKEYMLYAPHLVMFPGIAIVLTALSINLMGDGLRDALDPSLKD